MKTCNCPKWRMLNCRSIAADLASDNEDGIGFEATACDAPTAYRIEPIGLHSTTAVEYCRECGEVAGSEYCQCECHGDR